MSNPRTSSSCTESLQCLDIQTTPNTIKRWGGSSKLTKRTCTHHQNTMASAWLDTRSFYIRSTHAGNRGMTVFQPLLAARARAWYNEVPLNKSSFDPCDTHARTDVRIHTHTRMIPKCSRCTHSRRQSTKSYSRIVSFAYASSHEFTGREGTCCVYLLKMPSIEPSTRQYS